MVGLTAATLNAASVVLTDVETALLEENVCASLLENARTATLLWGSPLPEELETGADVVLASDIIYNQGEEEMRALAHTVHDLLHGRGGTFLLVYEHRDDWTTLGAFRAAVKNHGFAVAIETPEEWPDDLMLFRCVLHSSRKARSSVVSVDSGYDSAGGS